MSEFEYLIKKALKEKEPKSRQEATAVEKPFEVLIERYPELKEKRPQPEAPSKFEYLVEQTKREYVPDNIKDYFFNGAFGEPGVIPKLLSLKYPLRTISFIWQIPLSAFKTAKGEKKPTEFAGELVGGFIQWIYSIVSNPVKAFYENPWDVVLFASMVKPSLGRGIEKGAKEVILHPYKVLKERKANLENFRADLKKIFEEGRIPTKDELKTLAQKHKIANPLLDRALEGDIWGLVKELDKIRIPVEIKLPDRTIKIEPPPKVERFPFELEEIPTIPVKRPPLEVEYSPEMELSKIPIKEEFVESKSKELVPPKKEELKIKKKEEKPAEKKRKAAAKVWLRESPFTEDEVRFYNEFSHFEIDINKEFNEAVKTKENKINTFLQKYGISEWPKKLRKAYENYRKALYDYYLTSAKARSIAPPKAVDTLKKADSKIDSLLAQYVKGIAPVKERTQIKYKDIKGTVLKKEINVDSARQSWHNKHTDGSGNVGMVLSKGTQSYLLSYHYDKSGNIYDVFIGKYGQAPDKKITAKTYSELINQLRDYFREEFQKPIKQAHFEGKPEIKEASRSKAEPKEQPLEIKEPTDLVDEEKTAEVVFEQPKETAKTTKPKTPKHEKLFKDFKKGDHILIKFHEPGWWIGGEFIKETKKMIYIKPPDMPKPIPYMKSAIAEFKKATPEEIKQVAPHITFKIGKEKIKYKPSNPQENFLDKFYTEIGDKEIAFKSYPVKQAQLLEDFLKDPPGSWVIFELTFSKVMRGEKQLPARVERLAVNPQSGELMRIKRLVGKEEKYLVSYFKNGYTGALKDILDNYIKKGTYKIAFNPKLFAPILISGLVVPALLEASQDEGKKGFNWAPIVLGGALLYFGPKFVKRVKRMVEEGEIPEETVEGIEEPPLRPGETQTIEPLPGHPSRRVYKLGYGDIVKPIETLAMDIEWNTGIPVYSDLYVPLQEALKKLALDELKFLEKLQKVYGKNLWDKDFKIKLHQYRDGKITEADLRDYPKYNELMEANRKLQELYDELHEYFGIQGYIENYEPHRAPIEIRRALIEGRLHDLPEEIRFWAEFERTDRLNILEEDSYILAQEYIRMGLKAKHFRESIGRAKEVINQLDNQTINIPERLRNLRFRGTGRTPVAKFFEDYVNHEILLRPDYLDQVFIHTLQKLGNVIYKKLKKGQELNETDILRILNFLLETTYASGLGRPAAGFKNLTQFLTLSYAWLGSKWAMEGVRRFFTKEGRQLLNEKQIKIDFPFERENPFVRESISRLGKGYRKLLNAFLYMFDAVDTFNRGATYLGMDSLVRHYWKRFKEGKITRETLEKKIKLNQFHKLIQEKARRLIDENKIDELAHLLADQAQARTNFRYFQGNMPRILRIFGGRIAGRFLAQFGSWQLWYFDFVRRAIAQRNYAVLMRLLASTTALTWLSAQILGINMKGWFLLGPFQPAPETGIPLPLSGPIPQLVSGLYNYTMGTIRDIYGDEIGKKIRGDGWYRLKRSSVILIPGGTEIQAIIHALERGEQKPSARIKRALGFAPSTIVEWTRKKPLSERKSISFEDMLNALFER